MAKLSVSIVTYNGAEVIGPCLQSLQAQTFEDFELIIIDNASQDATLKAVQTNAPQAKIIALERNIGFGAGHNLAILQSNAPWVLVLNQDVILQPDCLERLFEATLRGNVAVIGPCLLRSRQESPAIIDTAGLEKTWYYKVSDRGSNRVLQHKWQRSGFVWGISGACMLLRKSALQQIVHGGKEYFDETFFMYKEDVDLCARLAKQSWKAWYEASAVGYHTRTGRAPAGTKELREHRRRLPAYVKQYSYRNHWFVLIKHAPLYLLLPILVYELLKFAYVLVFEPRSLRYALRIFTNLPLLLKRRYGIPT